MGDIVIALDAIKAPKTVNNFVFLALHHYYDGVIFHRIINGFMCQGGDPTGTGRGGPGYRFEDELPKPREYQIGSVAMANAGPHTNGSQFFIVSGPSGVGLPPQYSLFGQVVKGLDIVDEMQRVPTGGGDKPEDRRGHQLGHHHRRRRLTSARTRRRLGWRRRPSSPTRRPVASRSAPRASPTRGRPAGSTAATSGVWSTGWGSSRSTRSTCSCAARSCPCSPGSDRTRASLIADASRDGELFEYWVHEACHVPVALHPYLRWTMNSEHRWKAVADLRHRRPEFIDEVRIRIRDDGPARGRRPEAACRPEGHLVGLGRRQDRARAPVLHRRGRGRASPERLRADLRPRSSRVIPAEVLALPTPPEIEARKELLVQAARHHGIGTFDDLTDYHRQRNPPCRPLIAELVEEGRLIETSVEGWTKPAYLHPDAAMPRRVHGAGAAEPVRSARVEP